MGSPTIFSGRRTKLLTADGLLRQDGAINDNDGVRNYISNGHFEVNVSGWNAYKNTAGVLPVNGTGGSPLYISMARNTSTPLSGQASGYLSKSATNAQGEGLSYDFTIDSKDKAKVLKIELDYMLTTTGFTAGSAGFDSDIEVYIYDVTNAVVIQPSSYKLLSNSTTLSDKFSATFQTSSNSTSYRLILHCATTSASGFLMLVDNVTVSPSQYVFGSPVTDWQSYTMTIGATTTAPTKGTVGVDKAQWRRVGGNAEITYYYRQTAAGTPGSGNYLFSLPPGLTIDTSKIASLASGTDLGVFRGYNGASNFWGTSNYNAALGNYIILQAGSDTNALTAVNASFLQLATVTLEYSFTASVPILGWSSSVQMSDSADTRVISARAAISGNTTISGITKVVNLSVVSNRAGMIDTTNNRFNISVPGDYQLGVSAYVASPVGYILVGYKVSGGSVVWATDSASTDRKNGSALITDLKAGDYVEVFTQAGTSGTVTVDSGTYFTLQRLSGPSAIAASESVNASYSNLSSTTLTAGTAIKFTTKNYDSNGAYDTSTGNYNAPISGKYRITFAGVYVSGAGSEVGFKVAGAATPIASVGGINTISRCNISITVQALAGQPITIATSATITAGDTLAAFTIERVGN